MSWKRIRDILSWLALANGLVFVSAVFIGEALYPQWQGARLPMRFSWVCRVTGPLTLLLAVLTLPRWQSFVAWLCLLAVVWLAVAQ